MPNRSTTGPSRPQPTGRVSLATLFVSFLTIGSTSFGGGLTGWIRRELVEKRRWLDDQQFLSSYALSQMVPGASNVNLAVLIGTQLRGVVGAVTAVAGMLLLPLAILLTLGSFYFAARGAPGGHLLNAALAGAGAAAIGFNIATGIRLARHNIRRVGPALIATAIVVGIGILRIPLLEVLLVMLPASLALTLLERAR
jgi:chromate transporter